MAKASDSGRSRFWHRIQGRLILLLLTVLVPILLTQAYVYHDWLEDRRAEELEGNLEIARAVAKSFETFLHSLINSESVIGLAFTTSQQITDADRKRILDRFQAENPEVRCIFWVNPGGLIVASSLRDSIGLDVSDRSYYQRIIDGMDWAVSELMVEKATGKPSFMVSHGIRDEKGELSGIVAASVNPDRLDDVLGIKRSEGGAVSIVDKDGMLVSRYPSVSSTWEERNWLREYPEYKEALQGKEVSKSVSTLYEGKNRLVGIVPMPSIGWAACAGRPEEIVMQPIVSQLIRHATLFFAIALGAFGAAVFISRLLSESVKQLRDKIIELGSGGTHEPVVASGPAELRVLADSFNEMAEKLRSRETRLRESQARLDLALRSAGMGTWHWDITENKRYFDDHACYLLGIDSATFTGTAEEFFAVLRPEDRETVRKALSRTLEKNVPYEAEYRTVGLDGSVHYVAARGKLVHDDEGKPIRLNGLVWDITERNRMEEELRRSHDELDMQVQERTAELSEYIQRLKLATEVARMGVWELDVKTERIVWDDRIFDILGIPNGESITYDHWDTIIHPDDVPQIVQSFWREVCEHGHGNFECRIIRPSDGALRHIQCAASAIFNDNKEMVKVIGNYFDITEQKRVQEELRAIPSRLIAVQEEERRRLASELHDSIGQTLAALKFRIEHVIDTLERLQSAQALQLLHEFVPILQGSIDETRAIYMGLKPTILADHGVLATLEWYRHELLKLYPNQHIELETAIGEEDIPENLKTAIFRIVQEALNNSFKHGKSEWVDVRLAAKDGAVELEISDDGVGMDLNYVMESCTAKSLGLVGMRERTEYTGGEFTIKSAPNEGTTVKAVWRKY